MKGTIKITNELSEQQFMESVLNNFYSGINKDHLTFMLSLYAMGCSWNYDKLLYYMEMLK